jgi:hypothetical protein
MVLQGGRERGTAGTIWLAEASVYDSKSESERQLDAFSLTFIFSR